MNRLLVFLRAPEPGAVKTRLARQIGAMEACDLYKACVELTLERLAPLRCETILCVDPPRDVARVRAWLGDAWTLWPQDGGTLGTRMARAIERAFDGGARQVVLIGTDSPWIRTTDVLHAFHALRDAEVVLGPTEDGGYYLVGLRRPMPALFQEIAWGTASVYEATRAKVDRAGMTLRALPTHYDVDHLADVERFMAEERRRQRTSATLERMAGVIERRAPCRS